MIIERATRRLSAAAVVVGLGILLLVGPMAPAASAATPVPALDSTFATLLNTLRTTLGIGTLTVDDQLSAVARTWSQHQANTGVMAHNPAVRTQVQGWSKLGENVGYGPAVTQIFNALVASPPHYRNMSDGEYTRIGIGTVTDPQGRVWTTHVFMRPKSGSPAAAPAVPAAPATTRAPAPVTTRAPRPATTVPVPATVAPSATVPVTVPVATTVAPPAPVEVAGIAPPTEAPAPLADPLLTASTPSPGPSVPAPVIALAGFLSLLVLGSGGFLIRRTKAGGRHSPATPSTALATTSDQVPR